MASEARGKDVWGEPASTVDTRHTPQAYHMNRKSAGRRHFAGLALTEMVSGTTFSTPFS
jgi:hypothetical protein